MFGGDWLTHAASLQGRESRTRGFGGSESAETAVRHTASGKQVQTAGVRELRTRQPRRAYWLPRSSGRSVRRTGGDAQKLDAKLPLSARPMGAQASDSRD